VTRPPATGRNDRPPRAGPALRRVGSAARHVVHRHRWRTLSQQATRRTPHGARGSGPAFGGIAAPVRVISQSSTRLREDVGQGPYRSSYCAFHLAADDACGPDGGDDPSGDGCSEITARFAGAMEYARRHAPRHELPGILQGLKEARRAAIAAAREKAASRRRGRRRAIPGSSGVMGLAR
jgi:hypothetical protein